MASEDEADMAAAVGSHGLVTFSPGESSLPDACVASETDKKIAKLKAHSMQHYFLLAKLFS